MFKNVLEKGDLIGIDVDNTVVGLDRLWYKWIEERYPLPWEIDFDARIINKSGRIVTFDEEPLPYNYAEITGCKKTTHNFFNCVDIYDEAVPYDGAKEVIRELRKNHEVIFISAIGKHGGHYNSKLNFLRRHFGRSVEMISAVSAIKYLVNVDVMIDDRVGVLEKFDAIGKKTIWRNDKTHQVEDINFIPTMEFTDWKSDL